VTTQAQPSRLRGNPWAVLVTLCLGFFMVLLDITIVNVAIPSIIDTLHAGLDEILWVINAYTLTYAVLLITAGRLGDRYGRRNVFTVGLVIFTLSSIACGLAQNSTQLILARVAQAVGGALLTPQTLAIITTIFPADRRGAAMGVWGAIAGVATITGPILGGVLVTYVDWRWIFFVNVPVGAVAIALSLLLIPDLRPGRRAGLELVGVLLASAALFCFTFALIEGQPHDWGTIASWGGLQVSVGEMLLVSVILTLLFLMWDARRPFPLIPRQLIRNRNFAVMSWVAANLNFGMIGLFLPITLFLQSALGFTAIHASLVMLPMSFLSMPMAPLAGRLSDRWGGKYIVMTGLALFALGMLYIAWQIGPDSDWLRFLPGTLLAGLGMGCTFAPMSTVAMRQITPEMGGAASGLFNTVRQLGGSVGAAAVGALLQNRLATALHDQAFSYSGQIPSQFRQRFVDGFSAAARGSLDVGRSSGSTSGLHLSGVPSQVAAQLGRIAHDVFMYGFIDAVRPTLLLPIGVLALGSVSCLAIVSRRAAARRAGAAPAQAGQARPVLTIQAPATPASRTLARTMADSLQVPLLDLTAGPAALAGVLERTLREDVGARRALLALLLEADAGDGPGIRQRVLELATRSGAVILDADGESGDGDVLRVSLGRPAKPPEPVKGPS
jgi:EmrB/QacA subfamily drug resistance transporter